MNAIGISRGLGLAPVGVTTGRSIVRRLRLARMALAVVTVWFGAAFSHAAEVIPPSPREHFNDYAGIVRPQTKTQLERELAQFERDTSNQIVVVIYPRMQSDSSIEDYATRVFEAWNPGQKRQGNGAILFVFSEAKRMRIQTGYGLEGALPDALCKQILQDEIAPHFRNGDFDGGLVAGVHAMMAAARHEYQGTGRTVTDARSNSTGGGFGGGVGLFVLFFIIILIARSRSRRSVLYGRGGRRSIWVGSPWIGGGGWGGGGFGGGGSFGGGGGGGGGSFSGGGGHTGGGGASGSW